MRREIGTPLPADLLAFYAQLDGCRVTWQIGREWQPKQRQGWVWLWPLAYVFGGRNNFSNKHWDGHIHEGDLWPATHADDEPQLRTLRPFEFRSSESYPCFELPLPTQGPTPVVMLAGELDDIRPLTLTLTDYLLRLLAGAGLEGWQEGYYVDEEANAPAAAQAARWREWQELGLDPRAVLLAPAAGS